MATNSSTLAPMFQQFPQPSRPSCADDSRTSYTETLEESCSNGFVEEDHSLLTLRRIMHKLDKKGQDLFKKFISKIEDGVPIGKLVEETLHDFRGSPVSDELENLIGNLNLRDVDDVRVTMDRGLDGDISASDEPRLERFKVRTVNIPGVVKQDQEQP